MIENNASCARCRFAEWRITPSGRASRTTAGQCSAPIPEQPVMLCMDSRPIHKSSIWHDFEGRCDSFKPRVKP